MFLLVKGYKRGTRAVTNAAVIDVPALSAHMAKQLNAKGSIQAIRKVRKSLN
jgi:hypothetical protein